MKRRQIAYALVFAASVTAGYLFTQPASAATQVTVAVNAQPVHYGYRYQPVPRYYYPRGYYAPHYYYSPRSPAAYWKWRNRYRNHEYKRYRFNDRHDHRGDRHYDRDRDHDRDRDRDHHRDRDGRWGR
jgi:hypothetical protein